MLIPTAWTETETASAAPAEQGSCPEAPVVWSSDSGPATEFLNPSGRLCGSVVVQPFDGASRFSGVG